MELGTGALSWWKCYWPDLKTDGLFRRNLLLNSLRNLNIVTLTLTVWSINSGLLTSLLITHLSSSLTDALPFLNLICHSKTDAQFMQDGQKAVWSIPYVSVALFPSLKHVVTYRSSKMSSPLDWIFEIHQVWQSGFSRVYSVCCCSCWFEPEIIKIGQSSQNMYSNKRAYENFKCQYKKCLKTYWRHHVIYIYIYIYEPYTHKNGYKHTYICIYACVRVYIYIYIYIYIYEYLYVCIYICMCVYMYIHIHTCMHAKTLAIKNHSNYKHS